MMATKNISQREAWRLKKRVEQLEYKERMRFNKYRSDYPGGIDILSLNLNDVSNATLKTAVKLDHALVIRTYSSGIHIYAIPKETTR